MKVSKKIIIPAAAILLFAILFSVTAWSKKTKITVGFYSLSTEEVASLKKIMSQSNPAKSGKIDFLELDGSNPLDKQQNKRSVKKSDIIFLYNGLEYQKLSKKSATIPADFLSDVTLSVSGAIEKKGNKIPALPILTDNAEIDINKNLLRRTGMTRVANWNDIFAFARAVKKEATFPISFAADDDETILTLAGALTEAISGKEQWNIFSEKIIQAQTESQKSGGQTDWDSIFAELSAEGQPFYLPLQLIRSLTDQKILSKEILNLKLSDIDFLMQQQQTGVVFTSLSSHRRLSFQAVNSFSTIYYPSDFPAKERAFTAPILLAIPFSNDEKVLELAKFLMDSQRLLSKETGLAPTIRNVQPADKEASDARYWVAASGSPLPSLSDSAFDSSSARHEAAQALRKLFFEL